MKAFFPGIALCSLLIFPALAADTVPVIHGTLTAKLMPWSASCRTLVSGGTADCDPPKTYGEPTQLTIQLAEVSTPGEAARASSEFDTLNSEGASLKGKLTVYSVYPYPLLSGSELSVKIEKA